MLKLKQIGLLLSLLFILAACGGSKPARFYIMNATAVSDSTLAPELADIKIVLNPVQLPDYLDKPQMVTRENDFQLKYNQYHRWAEPLQETVTRVLAENLAMRISPGQVIVEDGFVSDNNDYQILVIIKRFDKTKTQGVSLRLNWQLLSGDGEKVLHTGSDSIMIKPDAENYLASAQAHSQALAEFSEIIIKVIKNQNQTPYSVEANE